MFMGETHGAVDLVHLFSDNTYSFTNSGFTGGDFTAETVSTDGIYRCIRRSLGCGNLSGNNSQAMLYGLEFADAATELRALCGKQDT